MISNYENPDLEVIRRDYCDEKSSNYEIMMNLLHHDATKTPRLYYCGRCHSIETVSTFEVHKNDSQCVVFTKGQFSGKFSK